MAKKKIIVCCIWQDNLFWYHFYNELIFHFKEQLKVNYFILSLHVLCFLNHSEKLKIANSCNSIIETNHIGSCDASFFSNTNEQKITVRYDFLLLEELHISKQEAKYNSSV